MSANENARRRRPVAIALVLTAAIALLCCTGGVAAFVLTELASREQDNLALSGFGCGNGEPVAVDGDLPVVPPYNAAQMRNAAVIIRVGMELRVPPRGWVIAIATAMQESGLSNLGHLGPENDHDSIGLFQQRPSQGWGKPAQLRDPAYAARKFYEKLMQVGNWQRRSLTSAAQRVQRSAYPDAYAKHEPIATQIVNALTGGAARAIGETSDLRCAGDGEIAASGWTVPVPIGTGGLGGFRTAARPAHNGVDISVGKGTPIRAAATGRVLVSKCDPDRRGRLSCDVDGHPGKGGCGWFVDILHAGGVLTRYCHLVRKPDVRKNQLVEAGDVIGNVGSSGNSSGPHLHFEVHLRGDRSRHGAIDPVPFMQDRGAPLKGDG